MKLPVVLASTLLTVCLSSSLRAAPAVPAVGGGLHMSVGKPLTRVKDVLTDLARQSGYPILVDDTVIDTIGVTSVDKPTLEELLGALVPLGQGMTWQRIYLPQDAQVPEASALAAQVRALKTLAATGMVVMDPASPGAISFSKSAEPSPATPPAGMKTVYLITNEVVRAQRLANQKVPKNAPSTAAVPVDHAVAGMQTAADDLGKMTPDQQRQAIPLMFQQMMRMFQSIDPGVRDEMRQQWQQGRGQGGGTPGQ